MIKNTITIFLIIITVLKVEALYAELSDDIARPGKAVVGHLDNDLTYIISPDFTRDLVCLYVLIKTGSATEGEYLASGISHLTEHMIFKGFKSSDDKGIMQQIAALGGKINGSTTYDEIDFYITVPSDNVKMVLRLLKEVIYDSSINQEEFIREKDVIHAERRMRDDNPTSVVARNLFSTIYKNHPYRYPVIGRKSIFDQIDVGDVRSFYTKHFQPGRTILSIAGNVDPDEIETDIRILFESISDKPFLHPVLPEEPSQNRYRFNQEESPFELEHIAVGFKTVSSQEKDLYSLEMLSMLLGDGEDSLLHDKLVKRMQLAQSVDVIHFAPKEKGVLYIYLTAKPGNRDRIISEIKRLMRDALDSYITETRINRVLKRKKLSYYSMQKSVMNIAAYRALGLYRSGSVYFYDDYLDKLKLVKKSNILDAAKVYCKENLMSVSVLTPKRHSESDEKTAASEKIRRNPPEKITLSNGASVVFLPNDSQPMVHLRLTVRSGVIFESESNNGLTQLMSQTILGGTKNFTEDEIIQSVNSRGGNLSVRSGYNSITLSLDLLKSDLLWGIDLLDEIVAFASYPEEVLEREKAKLLAHIGSREDSLFDYGMYHLRKKIYAKHPYGKSIMGEKESVANLDSKKLLSWHHKFFTPKNMVLFVYGDIENVDLRQKVTDGFLSNLNNVKNAVSRYPVNRYSFEGSVDKGVERIVHNKNQAIIFLSFEAISADHPDRFTFHILQSILNAPGGLLFKTIRDDKGYAYSLSSYLISGIDTGFYLFYVATKHESIDSVINIVTTTLADLSKNGITDVMLEDAKKRLTGNHLIHLEDYQFVSLTSSLDMLTGNSFDDYARYIDNIKRVGSDDVDRILQNYLHPEKSYIMILDPGERKGGD